jgi:hypothetical protein
MMWPPARISSRWMTVMTSRRTPPRFRRKVRITFQKPSLDRNLTGKANLRFHAILYCVYPYAPTYRLMAAGYPLQIEQARELLGLTREIFDPRRHSAELSRRRWWYPSSASRSSGSSPWARHCSPCRAKRVVRPVKVASRPPNLQPIDRSAMRNPGSLARVKALG